MSEISELVSNYLDGASGAEEALEHALTDMENAKQQMPSMRQTKTSLLFTDIVGSSSTYESFGDEYGHEILAIHDALVKPVVTHRGGIIVKGTGDGILASFDSCGRSVKTAILIHQSVHKHNLNFPLMPLEIRIGVNVGPVIKDVNDVYGSSVNLAARITDFADPGSIFTTGIVHARCKDKGYQFIDRGMQSFKGFDTSIPIYQVSW
jgi:adenylate cyclase